MKLTRIYKLGSNAKTKDELQDVINYAVFALEKFEKEQNKKWQPFLVHCSNIS
jgi:hypothetical protein